MKPKLMIVDDHTLFRNSLSVLLREDDELDIVGDVANGKELLQALSGNQVELLLMDLNMPIMNGLEALLHVKEQYPEIKCLVVSMFNHGYSVSRAMDVGARGVVSKSADVAELRAAIHQVLSHGFYLNDNTSKIILDKMMSRTAGQGESSQYVNLSEKEIKIIKLIGKELTTAEIAGHMFLSPRTIEGIRLGIIEKTNVKNSAGLILYAVKNGLIEI